MASIVPITSAAFAPYGEVIPPVAKTSRDEQIAAWTAWAEKSYGAPVNPKTISVKAAGPALPLIEVHTNSPQLTVSFESPWVLAVLPDGITKTNFDPRRLRVFLVPPLTGVKLRAGLWHGPVSAVKDTDVLVVFRSDVIDDWTELAAPVPWDVNAGTIASD
jgi:ureidoglycolate hydrolase